MPHKPGNGSLSGLATLCALATATRDLASQRGFPNLARAITCAIEDPARAPSLAPGDIDRTHVFSRLSALQRAALLCFRDGCDLPASA